MGGLGRNVDSNSPWRRMMQRAVWWDVREKRLDIRPSISQTESRRFDWHGDWCSMSEGGKSLVELTLAKKIRCAGSLLDIQFKGTRHEKGIIKRLFCWHDHLRYLVPRKPYWQVPLLLIGSWTIVSFLQLALGFQSSRANFSRRGKTRRETRAQAEDTAEGFNSIVQRTAHQMWLMTTREGTARTYGYNGYEVDDLKKGSIVSRLEGKILRALRPFDGTDEVGSRGRSLLHKFQMLLELVMNLNLNYF